MKIVLLIVSLLIGINAIAQKYTVIKDVDILAEQKKVLVQNYPGIFTEEEIIDVEKLNSKHSKIFYKIKGVNFEAVVNSGWNDMLLVATCQEIPEEKLPAIVKDGFRKSKYGKYKIEKAFIASTPYSSNFYRIDVNPKGKKENKLKSLFYTHLGRYRKPPY